MPEKRKPIIGIIGGSGLYQLPGITGLQWKAVSSPWGMPSDELCFGRIGKQDVVFLPRHGRGHRHSPSDINYRANIDALKRSGVTHLLSVSAVGSLRKKHAPGTFVLVDQFIDRTVRREGSFFGSGCVAHVSLADPVCGALREALKQACRAMDLPVAGKGTYVCIEGPQFSTRAESESYRMLGADVIGMTNMPEARLAREAELHYASLAMVTDYDCWHTGHEDVNVEMVLKTLSGNTERAKTLLAAALPTLLQGMDSNCFCAAALEHAIITDPSQRDAVLVDKLQAIAGRVLNAV